MFFVYIIYCKTADIFYVGSSDDYERRLVEHNNHEKNKFTSKFDFWELKLVLAFNSRAEAMKMEKFIKKQKSKLFIEKLILGENLTGNLAQLVRVPHVRICVKLSGKFKLKLLGIYPVFSLFIHTMDFHLFNDFFVRF